LLLISDLPSLQVSTSTSATRKVLGNGDRERAEVRTLCPTLAYTGCRISEALALTADRVDLHAGGECIGIFRANIPQPVVQGSHCCFQWDCSSIYNTYRKEAC